VAKRTTAKAKPPEAGFEGDTAQSLPFGVRLEKTGAREIAVIMLVALLFVVAAVLLLVPSENISNYDGIVIALITNVFVFSLGAFAIKQYGNVQTQRNEIIMTRTNPRMTGEGEIEGAG